MNCANCGISANKTMLHRINEKGINSINWCIRCINKYEPELANNIKEDFSEIMIVLSADKTKTKQNLSKN